MPRRGFFPLIFEDDFAFLILTSFFLRKSFDEIIIPYTFLDIKGIYSRAKHFLDNLLILFIRHKNVVDKRMSRFIDDYLEVK